MGRDRRKAGEAPQVDDGRRLTDTPPQCLGASLPHKLALNTKFSKYFTKPLNYIDKYFTTSEIHLEIGSMICHDPA